MRWWRWSWRWLAAAAVAVIAIAAGVDRLLAGALSPVSDPLTAAWSAPLPAADDEQARLLAENARLRQRLADLEALAGAATRAEPAPRRVAARVIARPLAAGRRFLTIGAGRADEVAVGHAVVAGWSLIGRAEAVAAGRTQVRTLVDSEFRLPCRIVVGEDRSVEGVWAGIGRRDRAEVRWVEDADGLVLAAGALVVSAGGDGVPVGLILGRIATAERPSRTAQPSGHWRIEAVPARDAPAVDEVHVLVSGP